MRITTTAAILLALATSGCYEGALPIDMVKHIPITDLQGVMTQPGTGVLLDHETTWDGNGALYMKADGPSKVMLYQLNGLDLEETILLYRARLKTRDVEGKVYLEMYLRFPEQGTYFSRAEAVSLTGTMEWVDQETQFMLKKGENPDRIELSVVIDGTGDVWVDDIRLMKSPLPS